MELKGIPEAICALVRIDELNLAPMRTPLMFALVALLLHAMSLAETIPGQHPQEFDGIVTRSVHIKYLLFIPADYVSSWRITPRR